MKILTAIGNPILNEKLRNLDDVYVIGKDIQYQEGVLELLEEISDIDCLIICNNLPGEYGFYKLIKEIKNIKENMDIYVFLDEKNENIENYLVSQNIYKSYYLNEINFDEFIKNFENKKKDILDGISKEINEFKRLILNENIYEKENKKEDYEKHFENDEELKELFEDDFEEINHNIKIELEDNYSFVEEKISESFEKTNLKNEENTDSYGNQYKDSRDNFFNEEENFYNDIDNICKTIAISGNFGVGKSLISSLLSKVISKKNKKTILIDFDVENSSINTLFGFKKYKEKQKYIEDYIFNVDEKLDILSGIDRIINFKGRSNSYVVKEIIERLKNEYEFIIIDVSSRIDFKYVKIILTFCDRIIFLIEPNLLEISKSNKILEVFMNDFEIDVDKIKIVFNKTNRYKIAEVVLEEIFSEFEIIENLEYEEKYNLFINKNTNCDYEKTKFENIYEKLIKKEEVIYANTSVGNY